MQKFASKLKKGDKIRLAEQSCVVDSIEISEVGKQGKRKVRLVVMLEDKEKLILIRPEDYPFNIL